MSHRLLHSLVFSSVVVLEGVGCAESHARPMLAPDASVQPPDASMPVDASVPVDASMPVDVRLCEEGWPTTKATTCVEVEGMDLFRCCRAGDPDPDACCFAEPSVPEETP